MTNTAKALYQFFSAFDLPAYVEKNVPDNAELPYITYELATPDWRAPKALRARVWYNSTSYVAINRTVDAIGVAIGEGKSMPTEGGSIKLYKDTNFVQYQATDEPSIKVAYLSMILHAHTT